MGARLVVGYLGRPITDQLLIRAGGPPEVWEVENAGAD